MVQGYRVMKIEQFEDIELRKATNREP